VIACADDASTEYAEFPDKPIAILQEQEAYKSLPEAEGAYN